MIADKILPLLEGVRQTSTNTWVAICPSHDDGSPSLSIKEADDRLLIHCFAGCSVGEVVGAVRLELSDLYPERRDVMGKRPLPRSFRIPARDVLSALAGELTMLQICAVDMAAGEQLEPEDLERLTASASRFRAALAAAGVARD